MPEQIENKIIIGKKPKRLLHNLQGKKFHKLTVIKYYMKKHPFIEALKRGVVHE